MAKVAIVGGGVAGVSTALILSQMDADISLFEMNSSLVSGPPFCHLHAGGNLYPDITNKERIQLLKESIEFLKFYPYTIDYRPTVITFPKRYEKSVKDFIPILEMLKKEYENLVKKDNSNKVLGEVKDYYQLFYREDLEKLKNLQPKDKPKTIQDWLIPIAKYVNLDTLQFPIIVVQEYGLNMFRLSAGANILLNKKDNVNLYLNTKVENIKRDNDKFIVEFNGKKEKFDYLINAAGFNSGTIDDMLGFKKQRLVEFKAAYVTKWDIDIKFPEIIFHGKRGSDKGMGQFTPYPNNYFQLHGMTKKATLFNNGLAKTDSNSSQPKLDTAFLDKIYKGWSQSEVELRTKEAIKHLEEFIPKFAKEAKVAAKPLFGAQQIPGCNIELRAAEVEFEKNYARCEIVKVSSALTMAKAIAKELHKLGLIKDYKEDISKCQEDINLQELKKLSCQIAKSRGYPEVMGNVVNEMVQ